MSAADSARIVFAHGMQTVTLGELAERAAARAGQLAAHGVGGRDRVAIALPAGLGFVEAFWALALIGATPCAFNPHVPPATLKRRIERIRPALVVTEDLLGDRPVPGGRWRPSEISDEDLAFLQLTSGTSGEPRASMISHGNIMASVSHSESLGTVADDDVLISWVPPWHDLGLVRFIIEPVCRRLRCHILRPAVRTIGEWLTTISEVGGTWSAAPDFAYRLATRMVDPGDVDLCGLRVSVNGGEPVRRSTIEAFERRFSLEHVVAPAYGLGEATLGVSTTARGEALTVDDRGNVGCGRPLPGIEVRAGRCAAEPDEILVRGDTVFAGYFDAPEETARTLRGGWLHTGDSGYLDREGRLFVLGRRRGMIKRAGAVIAPRELEEAAQRAEGVRIAAAADIPASPGAVSRSILVAVEADPAVGRPANRLAAAVSGEIADALGFAPDRVVVFPPRSIPRTENGKIRHEQLTELLATTHG
jgi:acyl-CoA synthetase (AMP-forming)/AMP-acid ligase II